MKVTDLDWIPLGRLRKINTRIITANTTETIKNSPTIPNAEIVIIVSVVVLGTAVVTLMGSLICITFTSHYSVSNTSSVSNDVQYETE
ncbi:MAG: hypothetical protein ACFFBD_28500 [Candidatus Hodarchaeota archaeon]